jgi:hypothetical protein
VDDLAANTVEALLGALCAPVLALIQWQYRDGVPSAPRPVTAGRRFLGMACDLLSIWLLAGALVTLFNLVVMARGGALQATSVVAWTSAIAIGFLPAGLQLVLVLVFGRTLGEIVVRLRPATSPSLGQRITRWATRPPNVGTTPQLLPNIHSRSDGIANAPRQELSSLGVQITEEVEIKDRGRYHRRRSPVRRRAQ